MAAKKTTRKKSAAKTSARKKPAKKSAKRSAGKKTPARKSPAGKPSVKKSATRKSVTRPTRGGIAARVRDGFERLKATTADLVEGVKERLGSDDRHPREEAQRDREWEGGLEREALEPPEDARRL